MTAISKKKLNSFWEASPGVKEFAKKNGRSTDESKRQIERIHEAIEKGEILGFTYGKYGFFLVA